MKSHENKDGTNISTFTVASMAMFKFKAAYLIQSCEIEINISILCSMLSVASVVSVVILAEDKSIQEKLEYYDLHVQTIDDVSPTQVYPARVLSHLFSHLGE